MFNTLTHSQLFVDLRGSSEAISISVEKRSSIGLSAAAEIWKEAMSNPRPIPITQIIFPFILPLSSPPIILQRGNLYPSDLFAGE